MIVTWRQRSFYVRPSCKLINNMWHVTHGILGQKHNKFISISFGRRMSCLTCTCLPPCPDCLVSPTPVTRQESPGGRKAGRTNITWFEIMASIISHKIGRNVTSYIMIILIFDILLWDIFKIQHLGKFYHFYITFF